MKGNQLIVGALVAAAMTMTGCTVTFDFDPLGNDVSLEGTWTINSGVPDAATCANAGVDTVQLRFYDGSVAYDYSQFRFPCSQGSFDTFPDPVLANGRYQTQWIALDSAGFQVGTPSAMLILDVADYSVTHAILANGDMTVAATGFNPMGTVGTLGATWTINGIAGDATNCASAGIATIQMNFFDVNDTGYLDGVTVAMAPCSDGAYDSRPMALLAAGDYLTSIAALDSAGATIASFESEFTLTVGAVDHYNLMTAPFEAAVPTLTVTMNWEDALGSDAHAACDVAGVDTIVWALNDSTGTPVAGLGGTESCSARGDEIVFEGLVPGEYQLYVDAESADRSLKWQGTHTMLVYDGMSGAYNCFYDQM
ncbi:MAG: hypothetical protein DRJ42_22350 [Deltaproteobacteria bacterium]|nr:MAG: hypothetical protein DRJ42_22350 [Deltaproteobacteria bacterium]